MKNTTPFIMLLALTACSTELNPSAREVQVAKSLPPKDCRALGAVYGSAGGAGYTSTETKMKSAHNDLRNRAAEIGANLVVLDAAGADVSGFVFSGTAFQCAEGSTVAVRDQQEEPERVAAFVAPAGTAEVDPLLNEGQPEGTPRGSVGFLFGESREQTSDTCVDAGHTWTREGDVSHCSGLPAELGTPGEAQIDFCEGEVCKIVVTLKPGEKELIDTFGKLRDRLQVRYGSPRDLNDTLSLCNKALSKCLEADAQLAARWYWQSGHAIELEAISGASPTGAPALRMTHSNNAEPPPVQETEPQRPVL